MLVPDNNWPIEHLLNHVNALQLLGSAAGSDTVMRWCYLRDSESLMRADLCCILCNYIIYQSSIFCRQSFRYPSVRIKHASFDIGSACLGDLVVRRGLYVHSPPIAIARRRREPPASARLTYRSSLELCRSHIRANKSFGKETMPIRIHN